MNDPTVLSARTNQGGSFDVTAAETGDPIAGLLYPAGREPNGDCGVSMALTFP